MIMMFCCYVSYTDMFWFMVKSHCVKCGQNMVKNGEGKAYTSMIDGSPLRAV